MSLNISIVINITMYVVLSLYIIIQCVLLLQKKKSTFEAIVNIVLCVSVLVVMEVIADLSLTNSVLLSRVLVISTLVIFIVTIFVLLKYPKYFVSLSIIALLFIYLTITTVLMPSSEVIADPHAELLRIEDLR
ncbi:MAG: hypothetical protein ACRDAO_02715 [Culicoidibacterales bacterium]